MTHASLFTGIGGFDLAAEWMGWKNIFQCEIDEYCNKLLKQNFTHTIKHGNIKEADFTKYKGTIDILSGGFPCQPYSTAGKRLGTEDDRHLWPEMLRAIREIQPRWVVGENVRGLTNWNGGLVFDEVQSNLENEGYEVTPFLLPAASVNAPHRRDRIWFIAYAGGYGYESRGFKQNRCEEITSKGKEGERQWIRADAGGTCQSGVASNTSCGDGRLLCRHETHPRDKEEEQHEHSNHGSCRATTNTASIRQSGQGGARDTGSEAQIRKGQATWSYDVGGWPTQPPICGRNDGISNRVDRLKGLGNAVVPQVVLQIFKTIDQYENINHE